MPNVYVEPQPTGRPEGTAITGYHLKLAGGKKLVETTFATLYGPDTSLTRVRRHG